MSDPQGLERRRGKGWGWWLGLAVLLGAVLGFAWLLVRAQALPSGVVPVAWDKETCAYCRMHVGDRFFAAQLQLKGGRVLNFDDPGCMLSYVLAKPQGTHAIYLHHHQEERWLTRDQVGFVEASPTPMGFGLGATDSSTPGALNWEQALDRIRARAEKKQVKAP